MTNLKKESLRKVKMIVVIGAMLYLAEGLKEIGNDMEHKSEPRIFTQSEFSIMTSEPEYQSIINSYDAERDKYYEED